MQVCSVCSRAKTNLSTGAMCPYPYQNQCFTLPWAGCCEPRAPSPTLGTINTKDLEGVTSKVLKEPLTQVPSPPLCWETATSHAQETPPLHTFNLCFWTRHELGPMFHARRPAMCLMEFIETSRAGFNLLSQSPWVWKCMYQEEREGKERETRNQSTKWVHLKPQPALMWGLILLSGLTPLPQVLGLRGDRFPLWIA